MTKLFLAAALLATTLVADSGQAVGDSWVATTADITAPSARTGHTAVWSGSQMLVWGGTTAAGVTNTGGKYNPATYAWSVITTTGAPSARNGHTAVWCGGAMLVWGGTTATGVTNTGGEYVSGWTPINTIGAPSARSGHTAVCAGSEMIVFGGRNASGPVASGAKYNPATNTWAPLSTIGQTAEGTLVALEPREQHTAVWSGATGDPATARMYVWGGLGVGGLPLKTGWVLYAEGWRAMDLPRAAPFIANVSHTAVLVRGSIPGDEVPYRDYMVVWGGKGIVSPENTGATYYLASGTWVSATSNTDAPAARSSQTAVTTGQKMIIWGGEGIGGLLGNGGIYDQFNFPRWTAISTADAPSARSGHTAVWTGTTMVIWGGTTATGATNTGGIYTP